MQVSAFVAVALKSVVLSSGTYIPGKTSHVLHCNISIGILLFYHPLFSSHITLDNYTIIVM
jgi:hypothetical protein